MDTFYAIYKDGVLVRTVHTNSKASDTMERISGVFANGMIRRLAFSTTPATPYSGASWHAHSPIDSRPTVLLKTVSQER